MEQSELLAASEQIPAEKPRRTKVAILGFVEHWKLAPFDDPTFEIWGLNELYLSIPRWDRWFELHDRRIYENDRHRTSEHIQRLRAMTCPVYMHQHWDDIPNSVPYPLAAIAQMFPNPCPEAKPYLNNSISYMILLAIAEGFQEIHIYGVDMAHDSEYHDQRPSCEYVIGIAQGRGIKVYIPSESDLLKTLYLYGYEQLPSQAWDRKLIAQKGDIEKHLNNLEAQIAQLIEARAQYRGAHQAVDNIIKNWKSEHKPGSS